MINKSSNESTLEKIYNNLESGMPENNSIKEYALPNARQWLGGRFVAIWVLPIYFLRKLQSFLLLPPLLSHILLLKMGHLISNQKPYLLLYEVFSGVMII